MRLSLRTLFPLIVLCLALAGAAAPRGVPSAAAGPALTQPAQADCTSGCSVHLPIVSRPPIAPILNDPADQAQVDSIAPTLTWFPAASGTNYTIQIATSSDFISGTVEISTTRTLSAGTSEMQRNVPRNNLHGQRAYFWRVGVSLPGGIHYSPTWRFTTTVDDPARYPLAPEHLSPPAGAKITSTTPTLVWAALPDADAYRVKIIERTTGMTVRTTSVLDAPQTSYTVPAGVFAHATTYRWQIKAHTSYGWGEYGTYWDIKVQ
jgi:hypothetical protein